MSRRSWFLAVALAVVNLVTVGTGTAAAQAPEPTIAVDRATVRAGESVVVSLAGWTGRVITVSVCGNLAARGSMDCNQIASEGIGRNRDGSTTSRDFVVLPPPVPCPCVLRAATVTSDEVAVAPIELVGHPVADVVAPDHLEPVTVTVAARRDPRGPLEWLRSALGGPTTYEVTIEVENRSGRALGTVGLSGAAVRGGDDVADLDLPGPLALAPGEVWEHTARATVPAPVVGTVGWEVTASGAGPAVTGATSSRSLPLLLVGVVVVLAVDVVAIVRRRALRRRVRDVPPPDDRAMPEVHGRLTAAS